MKQKSKFYLLLTISLIIVVSVWLFTLKINLQNGFDNNGTKSGLSFADLKNEIASIFDKSPLTKSNQQPTINKENDEDDLKNLTEKLAQEIKNLEDVMPNLPEAISISELIDNKDFYLDKEVMARGIIEQFTAICTLRACPKEEPCCNGCNASLGFLLLGNVEVPIYGEYNGKSIGCNGNDCGLDCYPFEPGQEYEIKAVLKINPFGRYYFESLATFKFLPDTSDWQTYTNEEYGFEFKHPNNWSVSDKDNILKITNQSDQSQKIEVIQSSGPPPETMDVKLVEAKNIKVDNYQVKRELFKGRFEHNKDDYYLRVFIAEKSIFYHADFNQDDFETSSSIYNQILSTFKFLE